MFCDNMAVVQVVDLGKSKDDFLAACIRNIWLLTATFDTDLYISLIKGTKQTQKQMHFLGFTETKALIVIFTIYLYRH